MALLPAGTRIAQALEVAQQAPARRVTASEVFGGGRSRGGNHPDLPGEEDLADSNWRSW
jgi:hypothetical protein